MAAKRQDISRWFDEGQKQGKTHMIIVCDTFDHEDYPVYVNPEQNARALTAKYREEPMQRVMEVYNLKMDKEVQLSLHRSWNY